MQIRFENYEKCYPKRLKRLFRTDLNYSKYIEYIPNMKSTTVGNMPSELINYFPKENRGHCIKEVQRVFSDMTRFLRAKYNKDKYVKDLEISYLTNKPGKDLLEYNEEISNVFNKILGRIPEAKGLKGELGFVGSGAFGSVYRVSLKDAAGKNIMHDKALKVYYNFESYCQYPTHNNYAEANTWTYLKYNVGHKLSRTQFTDHYISDLHSGYCLTEFADENIQHTKSKLDFENLFGIEYRDLSKNMPLYGKLYDIGGMKKKMGVLFKDKMVLRYFKKLFYKNSEKDLNPVLENLQKEAKNPKNEHHSKIELALKLFEEYNERKKHPKSSRIWF